MPDESAFDALTIETSTTIAHLLHCFISSNKATFMGDEMELEIKKETREF